MRRRSEFTFLPQRPGQITINSTEVRELKRLLDGPISEGTVDQLGFGVLFDSIAQSLFPWCSTLTTRVKYLIWSPAVLELAVEEHVQQIMGNTPRDRLDDAQVQALVDLVNGARARDLSSTVTKIESCLAIVLYYKEPDGRGIFGKRNLRYRLRRGISSTPKLISGRGLLSTAARYPNAIYWNSLSELGLYADGVHSKRNAIQHLINGRCPWRPGWEEQIDSVLDREIRPIWERFKRHEGPPWELCRGKWFKDFPGFCLDLETQQFLIDRFKKSTPFWEPIFKKTTEIELENTAKTYLSLASLLTNHTAKQWCNAATLAIEVYTPIREIYEALISGKIESECARYDWHRLQRRLTRLKRVMKKLDGLAYRRNSQLFAFLDNVTKASCGRSSKPTKRTVELLAKRERYVLSVRRKAQKRLLLYKDPPGPHGYRSREALARQKERGLQDAEVSENTFRLGSAINFFSDLKAAPYET